MKAMSQSSAQSLPWRPPLWPFRIPNAIGAWLRWTARIWLLAATAIFATMAVGGQIPRGLDREPSEVTIQLALLGVVILGELIAWRFQAIGASVITVGAIALGVMAAIQHSPLYALGVALVFFVPAFLYWLDWQRTRSVRVIATLAVSMAAILAAGGFQASQIYAAYRGPSHPSSTLAAAPVQVVRWVWSGAQTEHSIIIKAELARDSDAVYLALSESSDMQNALFFGPVSATQQTNNRVVAFIADGLKAGTRYYYAIQADDEMDLVRRGQFRTFAEGPFSFTFALGGCALTGSNGRVFDTIREADPLFFLSTGDFFYENIFVNDQGRYRAAYDKVLMSASQSALYRSTPIVYVWDDHDFGPNNADRTARGREAAQQVYRQLVPSYALATGDSGPIYRAFSVGRVRFIVTDARSEKAPSSDPDNATKTVLGAEQKEWFKRELLAANETYSLIVWVNSVPWIGAASATADHWGGYATERRELADFIAQHQIKNLMMLSGDAHMVAIDNGTNSDYATNGGAGFPIFHGSALDRPGSVKGGPYSEGTFPGGGQFGLVTVNDNGGDTITVTLSGRNYTGKELVNYAFTVPAGHQTSAAPTQNR